MLIRFFFMLREGGIKVSITEFLTLLEVLEKRIAGYSVEQFYYLARACLVKAFSSDPACRANRRMRATPR